MVIKLLKTFVAVYVVALVLVQFCVVYSLSAVTNAQTIPMAPDQLSLSSTDAVTSISQTNIVSLSIIIDEANHFDQLAAWLRTISFRNFTFVVVEGTTNAYILENTTRLNILKEYGRIIPRLSYMQGYELSNRLYNVNFTLNEFKEALGYTPKGVMDFIPDTYTAKYLLSRGVEYYQGYSFDQYNIDYMTMRGGFQMPYYANGSNILCPNTLPGGMVVLPHSTWDWVASFNVTHNLQLHPMNILNYYNRSVSAAKNYFISLVDNTFSGSSPFGYVTIQFEWSWLYRDGSASVVSDWIQTLFSSRQSYNYWTFEDTITWFKANYDRTPTYEINFISPHNEERIEWYYDLQSRIARSGGEVVSFVDYFDQKPDKYLDNFSPIQWRLPPNSTNVIDSSLIFKIDALGGGYLRAPIINQPVAYTEDLSSFRHFYDRLSALSNFRKQPFTFFLATLIVMFAIATTFVKIRKRMNLQVGLK